MKDTEGQSQRAGNSRALAFSARQCAHLSEGTQNKQHENIAPHDSGGCYGWKEKWWERNFFFILASALVNERARTDRGFRPDVLGKRSACTCNMGLHLQTWMWQMCVAFRSAFLGSFPIHHSNVTACFSSRLTGTGCVLLDDLFNLSGPLIVHL